MAPRKKAGLKKHDALLKADGVPLVDEQQSVSRIRGQAGTSVTITVQTPGQQPRDITLVRQPVSGQLPVDFCLVQGQGQNQGHASASATSTGRVFGMGSVRRWLATSKN